MPRDKYLQHSLSTLRYPHYMTQSLARLELRKPAFLCGESRVQDNTKIFQRSQIDFSEFQVSRLSEQSRRKLKRIQANPFLKSYHIYPRIQDCSLGPKLQKIQIHQKQQYIPKPQDLSYSRFVTLGTYQQTKLPQRQQHFDERAQKIAADIFRRQMDLKGKNEKQQPVKEELRSGSRHYTDYQKINRRNHSRYEYESPQKNQEIFYSQTNRKETQDHELYQNNFFPPSFNKITQQNQTIIQKLQDNNINQYSEDLHQFITNSKKEEKEIRQTGVFGNTPLDSGDILGVIQRINEQGQTQRQKYKSRENYPDAISVRGTTYFSIGLV